MRVTRLGWSEYRRVEQTRTCIIIYLLLFNLPWIYRAHRLYYYIVI